MDRLLIQIQNNNPEWTAGQVWNELGREVMRRKKIYDKEEILLRRPWTDEEDNQTYFRLRDFENYLKRNRFFEFKTHMISQRLRDIGGESTVLRIKNRSVRVWAIPAFEIPPSEIKTPEFGANDEDIPF